MSRGSGGDLRGPLAPHAPGFRADLARLGYSRSAAKRHAQLMARLSRWLEDEGLDVGAVAMPHVERFFHARRADGYANLLTPRSIVPLVEHLRRVGVVPEAQPPVVAGPVEIFLESFRLYLVRERGLVEGTVRFYVYVARLFVSDRLGPDGLDLAGLRAADVTGFTTRVCEHRGMSSSRQAVSALRSLLRFLQLEGLTDLALDQAVLSVAGSWNPSLPRAISVAHLARLLASCDRRRAIGRRDYAILLLLGRLGLRGGEVVALELGDVDWRAGEIVVHGKGRRHDRLPLPVDVGEALAAYLQRSRPRSDSRRLFLRCYAPFCGLGVGSGAIRGILGRACDRAGLPYVAPHHLRHTVATEMLRAGAPLSEIGQVLRHRSATTTAVYTNVDHEQLRTLARPWPGGAA